MKPITFLILCQHCLTTLNYRCEFGRESDMYDEPCTLQDYQVCPLKGMEDKDIREGKRK